jgi:hypothetical protein
MQMIWGLKFDVYVLAFWATFSSKLGENLFSFLVTLHNVVFT